jgi:hypothetical protein
VTTNNKEGVVNLLTNGVEPSAAFAVVLQTGNVEHDFGLDQFERTYSLSRLSSQLNRSPDNTIYRINSIIFIFGVKDKD